MPDQYDPKVSPRPMSDRRPADPRRGAGASGDDPLAELAKIVHGRPSASSAAASKQAAVAPATPDTSSDLEAELLNDLQASFAAVRDSFPPPPPPSRAAAPPPPPPPPPAPPPVVVAPISEPPAEEEELPSIFQPLVPPPEPAPPPVQAAAPRRDVHPELRDEFRPEPFDETRFVPIPQPPVIQPQIPMPPERPVERPAMERLAMERPPVERRVEPPAPPPPPPETMERAPRPTRQPAAAETRADLGSFQLRGSAGAPAMPVPPVRQPHSRWEKPEPPKPQPAGASRFAPPRAAPPPPPVEETPELDPFAEGGLFAELDEPADVADEFPLERFGTVPSYGDDSEHLPPLDDDLDRLVRRRRPNRNLIIVGAVAAVALAGGVAVAMLNTGGTTTGTPPVIVADGGPTKITPDDTTSTDGDSQNKLIYDRVNSSETSSDTTLVTPGDGPIKDVASNDTSNPISRVIIPGGPGIDRPASGDKIPLDQAAGGDAAADNTVVASDDAASGDAAETIGPRKVRTVVVKPDGTIVSSNAADAGTAAPADTTAAAPPAATTATTTTTTTTAAAKPPADTPPAEITDDTAAIAGTKNGELPITAAPDATSTGNATADTTAQPPVADTPPADKPVQVVTKPVKPPVKTTQVANADSGTGPIDLTGSAQPPAATSGGVLVQISSQRSEDAARATYRDLQARYPNILGRYDVNIQRADVPDRGTFYRVRVGPFPQSDAQRLCDDLRSAGGDCVLAKR